MGVSDFEYMWYAFVWLELAFSTPYNSFNVLMMSTCVCACVYEQHKRTEGISIEWQRWH